MDQKSIYVILALLAVASIVGLSANFSESPFKKWQKEYGMTNWSPSEEAYREIIFMKNMAIMEEHNSNPSRTYNMGINQFSALTNEQFAQIYLTPKPISIQNTDIQDSNVQMLGADVDWTSKGMVSPVKNQGNCGSCWAFSAVGVLESFSLMKGKAVNLSEQQLVDCSKKYGNEGCNGGFNYQGLAYVKDHGITTTSAYPYVAKTNACKVDGGQFKISSVPSAKGCSGISDAIQSRPIGVSVDATNWSRYGSGVFNNCGRNLNHDVLLVGMTSAYYKIKNSWSTSWGESGFIRLAPGNTCGICDDKSPWVA